MSANARSRAGRAAIAAVVLCVSLLPVAGQLSETLPADVAEVSIDQHLDQSLPLDASFVDENGRAVKLGDYFDGEKPVLLSLVYYRCPMLCGLVLNGMVEVLQEVDRTPGRDFELVTVTIDPREKPTLARLKKQSMVEEYRPEAAGSWHFLTGEADEIHRLADAVGFRYRYLSDRDEYAHPAALFVITPDGRISRYLFGVQHDPRTVNLSLVEAADGKIGSPVERFLLYCYRYDETAGRYAPVAMRIMRVGATLVALLLGAGLLYSWLRELRQKRLA